MNEPRPLAPGDAAAESAHAGASPAGSTVPGLVALGLLALAVLAWHPAAGMAGIAFAAIVLFGFAASLAPAARREATSGPAPAKASPERAPGRADGNPSRDTEDRGRGPGPEAEVAPPTRLPAEVLLAAALGGSALGTFAGVLVLASAALLATAGRGIVDSLGFAGVLLAGAAVAGRDAARALSREAATALPAIEAREHLGLGRRRAAMTSFGVPCFRVALRTATVLVAGVVAGGLLGGDLVAAATPALAAAAAAGVGAFTAAVRLADGLRSAPSPVPLVDEIPAPAPGAARPAVFDSRPDRDQEGGFADID